MPASNNSVVVQLVDYYFNNFKFSSLNLVLLKDGQPLAIRNNEAKLLAFFLANPQQVFSKDAILESVWAGKVVSEQAVFQAISNLRNVFGDEAIKTFPKKGYQWQLPLQQPLSTEAPSSELSPSSVTATNASAIGAHKFWLLGLAALVAIALSVSLYLQPAGNAGEVARQSVRVIVEPVVHDPGSSGADDLAPLLQNEIFKQASSRSLKFRLPPSVHSPQQVAAGPAHFLALYKQSVEVDLLVTGRVRKAGEKLYLSYVIQGRENDWRGYLIAENEQALAAELVGLLGKIGTVKVLWESADLRLVNAQLQLLYNENPDSLPTLYQLIDNLLYLGDVDKARLLAVELEQRSVIAGNIPYQALALQVQAFASFDTVDDLQYLALVDKSVALAAAIDDALLQAHLMVNYTPVFYRQKNFARIEEKLLRALALAEAAQAPEQQAELLRVLSIYSYKLKQADKRDAYLARVKAILDANQFPGESYALLEDIAGMVSDDRAQKEKFFWQALNRFKPEQEAWVKERAQEHLVDLYIDQQRWQDAFAVLARETTLSGAELWMTAKIHFKQNDFSLARTQAEAAFKQANISGEYVARLESAVLLAQIHQHLKQPDLQKKYVEYIHKNALPLWLAGNKEVLLALQSEIAVSQ
ncbi:MAG TPA: winged helix-turn-helix domain-containing protein [Cellvibrio sp.]|nr:winged helix-turn-helix domain-containing protein [Cellvibrio sp.]